MMLKRYGDRALEESAARADELALAGDDEGAATWRRIMAAVTQLANNTPPGRGGETGGRGRAETVKPRPRRVPGRCTKSQTSATARQYFSTRFIAC